VAVTAGYIHRAPLEEFASELDAANVDLKAFTEDFYHRLTFAHLQPVLDTLEFLIHETKVWTEITTLLIPGHNDSEKEVAQLSEWVATKLGPEVPLHFSAFHPDFQMRDVPPTPPETLRRARRQALQAGLKYVYTGNVHDLEGDTTWCAKCHAPLIVRDWYELLEYRVTAEGTCPDCGAAVAGHFDAKPGTWGRKRQRVVMNGAAP
jgi:pyruvate formate lyase activating enzyme